MTFPSLPSGSPDRGSPGPWFAMAGIVVIAVLAVVAVAQAQLPGIPRGLGAAMPSGVLVAVVEPTASPDAPAPASLGPIRGGEIGRASCRERVCSVV